MYISCFLCISLIQIRKAINDLVVLNWKGKFKRAKKSFEYLCRALTELNTVFAFPLFLFLFTRLILTSFCFYVSVFAVMSDNVFLKNMIPLTAVFSLTGIMAILILLHAADLPISQVSNKLFNAKWIANELCNSI